MPDRGFSLIEFIAVMLIVALLSVPVMTGLQGESIRTIHVAEQLAQDIRYIQMRAMTHGQNTRINIENQRYWFSNRLGDVVLPHPAETGAIVSLPASITVTSAPAYIVFDARGIPYVDVADPPTAATVDEVIQVTGTSSSHNVVVTPQTGYVRIE